MVLNVYDLENYRAYFDVHPIRKIANETTGYDCLLMGTRFGIGFIKDGKVIERPEFTLDVKGRIRTHEIYTVSDEREKTDISQVPNCVCGDLVKKLGIYQFALKEGDGSRKYGFIAQDVERTAGDIVNADASGKKSIDTLQLLALAIGAIQDIYAKLQA